MMPLEIFWATAGIGMPTGMAPKARIVAPATGDAVGGIVDVRLAPVGMDERVVGQVKLLIGDILVFTDTKLPTHFRLDTHGWPEGPITLRAEAVDGLEVGSDEVSVTFDDPGFRFLEATPNTRDVSNGDQIVVQLTVDVPGVVVTADFSALDSGFQTGAVTTSFDDTGDYEIIYTITGDNVRPDGRYVVPITGVHAGQTLTHEQLWLDLRNLPETPFRVESGIFVPGSLPLPSGTWSASNATVSSSGDFIVTGGSATLGIGFSGDDVIGIIVGLEGHTGYYHLPLDGSNGAEEAILLMRAFVADELAPTFLPVRVALVDVMGRVSAYTAHQFQVKQVGSGDLQVSVAWDTPTDVDLHVIEPGGCELYYSNTGCGSGGVLDLDSNPGCLMDNVNNENIFWPQGAAPVGDYIVRVDFFEDCCFCGANYTVTINFCGATEVHQGVFTPGSDDYGSAGSGVTVAEFSNEACESTLRGRVQYEDRTFDEDGFSANSWLPVRSGLVVLERASDGEVLGTTSTDRAGRYELQFSNLEPTDLIVKVSSRTDPADGLRDIQIMNHPKFKQLYVVSSPPFQHDPEVTLLEMDIAVPVEQGAGAFNVFDVVVAGHDLVRRMTGRELGELLGFWATGADTTDTLYCSQYFYDLGFCTELGALSVQGKDSDRDEYDDMVILKEFFKLVLERTSQDDNPGGPHDGTRDEPTQAWSEGVSTFFAADVIGTPYFVDSRPLGVYLVTDLETMPSPFAFETAADAGGDAPTMSGAVSEDLVAAVLWDLADAPVTEVFDGVHGERSGIFDSVFGYFNKGPGFTDRGVAGVDLVDFLDGWFCRGWGHKLEVQDIVVFHRGFPYDFSGPLACP